MKNNAIITQIGQMLFYMCQQYMVPYYCIKSITINKQNVWKSGQNDSNMPQSQMLFLKDKEHMVPDYCTK